jgi:hypothetical protein
MEKKTPLKSIKAGSITATIWENETKIDNKNIVTQTVVIQKNYKDKNDKWQSTNNFTVTDLPKVALVSQKAYEFIYQTED